MGSDLREDGSGVLESSTLATSLIVYSLGFSGSVVARETIERALSFLRAIMEPRGVWRYLTSDFPGYRDMPPDVDDTACISHALSSHGIAFPDNRRLLLANRDRRGRFYTWMAPRLGPPPLNLDYWRVVRRQLRSPIRSWRWWRENDLSPTDVACVVNANALLYLGDVPATKRVSAYLSDVVHNRAEASCDKWYRSRFVFYYAVSRCAHAGIGALDPLLDEIADRITAAASADGSIGASPLETALAACALINCRAAPSELDRACAHLIGEQSTEGGWPAAPLYYWPDRYSYGSAELTTGFCLEALLRHGTVGTERSVGKRPLSS
jgi:hypothetical protein